MPKLHSIFHLLCVTLTQVSLVFADENDGCQKFAKNGLCEKCQDGYLLQDGRCSLDIESSSTLNGIKNEVFEEKCPDSYFLDKDGKCKPCSFNCASCKSFEVCDKCKNNYPMTPTHQCFKCDEKCTSCKTPDTCEGCKSGYFLSSNKTCSACGQYCASCKNATICEKCQEGRSLRTNGQCFDCINQCETCQNDYTCEKCRSEYYYDTTEKMCLRCKREDCAICNKDPEICEKCNPGYFAKDGYCAVCNSSCLTCKSKTICESCKKGQYLTKEGKCSDCAEYCALCSAINKCTSCYYRPVYSNSTNKICYEGSDSNCLIYQTQYTCAVCKSNYIPDSKGKCQREPCPYGCDRCQNSSSCDKCLFNTEWNEKYQVCKGCEVRNCKECPEQGKCHRCAFRYFYIGNQCISAFYFVFHLVLAIAMVLPTLCFFGYKCLAHLKHRDKVIYAGDMSGTAQEYSGNMTPAVN